MDYNKIRFIGRHIQKNGKEYFSYSGCGFEFVVIPRANSCSISLSLIGEVNEHDSQYIAIYINDVFHSKEKLNIGLNSISLSLDNIIDKALIRVIKLNEAYLSSIYLEDIVLSNAEFGDIEPSKKELIGFFGDSLTCGFGLIDWHGEEFKMETEEFIKTYAYLATQELDMDYSVVARSGISLALPIYINKLFGEIYDTVDMFDRCVPDRKLDYAVINLGANDNSALFQNYKEEERPQALGLFKDKYIDLVNRIIKDNSGVVIIMVFNMLSLTEQIENAIKEIYQHISSTHKNCKLVKLVPNSDGGCCHPYMTAHEENAKLLAEAIKEISK